MAASSQCCSRLLAEYSDLLGLATEQDVVILGDELESGDPADLIRRVEDLLGKTKAKDGRVKPLRTLGAMPSFRAQEGARSSLRGKPTAASMASLQCRSSDSWR